MKLSSLHLLLTYQCVFECDHCFAWGSPRQSGTLTLEAIRRILEQARELGTVEAVYFEGGEPFLYYAVLLVGVRMASSLGFQVGIVSNAYWATEVADAVAWLNPLRGMLDDLSISSDLYHYDEKLSAQAESACAAAEQLGIPVGVIAIARPGAAEAAPASGQLPAASRSLAPESAVMYRGRAAETLAAQAIQQPWEQFSNCPHEDLREPGRVHVDPFGTVHLCQGISLGNLFDTPLVEICQTYDPDSHPIAAPLLRDGPAGLARYYGLPHHERYADACHLCYETRKALRGQFPKILTPDSMYGIFPGKTAASGGG